MVSVTITFEIFKLRYYVYCALFDLSCKLLLSIYIISAMCYTYYCTYYSSIFCLIYYRVVVKINLYQCQCQAPIMLGKTIIDVVLNLLECADIFYNDSLHRGVQKWWGTAARPLIIFNIKIRSKIFCLSATGCHLKSWRSENHTPHYYWLNQSK